MLFIDPVYQSNYFLNHLLKVEEFLLCFYLMTILNTKQNRTDVNIESIFGRQITHYKVSLAFSKV